MAKYFPLKLIEFAQQVELGIWGYDKLKALNEKTIGMKLPDDKDDFIHDLLDIGANSPQYIKKMMMTFGEQMVKFTPESLQNGTLISDIKDVLVYPVILEKWSYNKQVYKTDRTFFKALLETKSFSLSKFELEHLPNKNFYLDFEDVPDCRPFVGAFVEVYPMKESFHLAIFLITDRKDEPAGLFSHYIHVCYDENGMVDKEVVRSLMDDQKDIGKSSDGDLMDFKTYGEDAVVRSQIKVNFNTTRAMMTKAILQILKYISSVEPEITVSEDSKRLYKKPSPKDVPKNSFSEVMQYEVGVRYGKAIRTYLSEQKRKEKRERRTEKSERNMPAQRKSPRPHFRFAHWCPYHVGKGRTDTVYKWLEPQLVGADKNGASNNDVIIHKMS